MAIDPVSFGMASEAVNAGSNMFSTIYNAAMQQNAWKREDTAVQRRVDDLKAAGLSPVLAAGSAAQASPANQMQAKKVDPLVLSTLKTQKEQRSLVEQQRLNAGQDHLIKAQQLQQAQHKTWTDYLSRYMQQSVVDFADGIGVPAAFLNTPAGQARASLEVMRGLSEADRAKVMGLMAAGTAGKIVNTAVGAALR